MGFNSLRDLELAGVKWELSEPGQKNTKTNKDIPNRTSCAQTDGMSGIAPQSVAPIPANLAKENATSANDFETLCNIIKQFDHPIKMFAKNTILPQNGEKLLIITDTPSSDDDESGEILSGRAGELFNKMITAIGLTRDSVAICPLIFWRTPGGRTPSEEELELTRPFVDKFIELTNPSAVLTLGTLATKQISNTEYDFSIISIPHPNYMILKPESKKTAWDQLQKLLKSLE